MALVRTGTGAYRCDAPADTERLGELVAGRLADGDVLVLTGGLGVGKTRFTKGVSRGLGDPREVTSPTFSIMAEHDGGRIPLFHFDLYRLERADQLEDTGIYDVLGYEGACLLEWGEQFRDELCDDYLQVDIARLDGPAARPEGMPEEAPDPSDAPRAVTLRAVGGERPHELLRAVDEAVRAALGDGA